MEMIRDKRKAFDILFQEYLKRLQPKDFSDCSWVVLCDEVTRVIHVERDFETIATQKAELDSGHRTGFIPLKVFRDYDEAMSYEPKNFKIL